MGAAEWERSAVSVLGRAAGLLPSDAFVFGVSAETMPAAVLLYGSEMALAAAGRMDSPMITNNTAHLESHAARMPCF